MGCDIHSYVEVKIDGIWCIPNPPIFEYDDIAKRIYNEAYHNHPFEWRDYGVFDFLADVRNYSKVPPIAENRGMPDDVSEEVKVALEGWEWDGHSYSWLSLKELTVFDYDATFEDRRTMKQTGPNSWSGAGLADEGEGRVITFRKFLGGGFFKDLKTMKKLGKPEDVRIAFWFDN